MTVIFVAFLLFVFCAFHAQCVSSNAAAKLMIVFNNCKYDGVAWLCEIQMHCVQCTMASV